MFETLYKDPAAIKRYRLARLLEDRERYLCAVLASGAVAEVARRVARAQLALMDLLNLPDTNVSVGFATVQAAVQNRCRPGTVVDGPTATGSPVRGFPPVRTERLLVENLPNPTTLTSSPRVSASAIAANAAPTAASASRFVRFASSATRSAISPFFIRWSPLSARPWRARPATRSPTPPNPAPDP